MSSFAVIRPGSNLAAVRRLLNWTGLQTAVFAFPFNEPLSRVVNLPDAVGEHWRVPRAPIVTVLFRECDQLLGLGNRQSNTDKCLAHERILPQCVKGVKYIVPHPIYALLTEIISAAHEDLASAKIALAWCTSWVPDADGHVTIGKCKRASDLDRELADFDFIILLRRSFWLDDRVTDGQRRALLDHELCHAGVRLDAHGDPAKDDRGRIIYRTRKHDIEEFTDIVARHGTYKADLEAFAKALVLRGVPEFTPCDLC